MRRAPLLSSLTLASFLTACGDEATPPPAGLDGAWNASAMEFVNAAITSQRVDFIQAGGTFLLILRPDNTYETTMTPAGESPTHDQGTWSATDDVLTITPEGMPWNVQFDLTLSGNTLALRGGHLEFDFDDDGTFEEAICNLTLSRLLAA